MVFLRATRTGPENRDERGAYEDVEDRVIKYMNMPDDQWLDMYNQMYNDRRYPGVNSFKWQMIPFCLYTVAGTSMGYELYMSKNFSGGNMVKLALLPLFGVLALRSLDRGIDVARFRMKYPEMYQV